MDWTVKWFRVKCAKMGNPSDKRSGLSSAVQWCFYVSVIATCGYSFVRQQRLEQRLRLLEDQHFQLEETVFSFHEPQEDVLTRKARDVTDCICPSEITLQRKWKGIRGCFTRELRRQGNVKAGIDPGARKSEYTHFKQMLFLRNVVTRRTGNNEYLYYEEPTTSPTIIKQENCDDGDNSSSKFDDDNYEDFCQLEDEKDDYSKLEPTNEEYDSTDPLRDVKHLTAKKPRYDSMTDDDDLLFLLSMLKTLKKVPLNKKMATKMNIMAVLHEATKDLEV